MFKVIYDYICFINLFIMNKAKNFITSFHYLTIITNYV